MYDPMTEIHTFRIFGHSILAIWHVDPETDGTDDSCGWFNPKVTEREEKIIAEMVDWDMEMPYYSSPYLPLTTVNPKYDYSQMLAGDCLSFVAWTWLHIAWHIRRDKKMTILEWWDVVSLSSNPYDNLRSVLADPDETAEYKVNRFFHCVMKAYLRHHRPWWKHPRWHIHHWQFQVHFIQTLKRWLFSQCAHCGRRFSWGYYPTASWDHGQGPRWFRSEGGVFHHRCYSECAEKSNVDQERIEN